MANTIFEKQGGTYTQVGDYMLPDLLPAEEEKEYWLTLVLRWRRNGAANQTYCHRVGTRWLYDIPN